MRCFNMSKVSSPSFYHRVPLLIFFALFVFYGKTLALSRTQPAIGKKPKRIRNRGTQSSDLWRFSKPKRSRWDIKHTKNFRFELKVPKPASVSAASCELLPLYDCLTMHKKPRESLAHVLGKGFLWALFKGEYGQLISNQTILIETPIPQEQRFVPDAVAFDLPFLPSDDDQENPASLSSDLSIVQNLQPTFWGESGRMSVEKAQTLSEKYPHTHIVHFRSGSKLTMDIFEEIETAVLSTLEHRTAPFEFALLADDPRNYLKEDGTVSIKKEDLQWRKARFDIDRNF